MKISIVTPSFDRADYLKDTIESVLTQAGDFDLEYVIQNAGESAAVREILDRWESKLASGAFQPRCRALRFLVVHERDSGMYDGINRGFARCSGDIMAWVNSDDLYHPKAFQTVTEAFSQNPAAHWVVGIANSFNARGSRAGFDKFPPAYSREFVRRGLYRIENLSWGMNWIPQDCSFWRADLWRAAGGRLDERYKYAADFQLWHAFAEHTELVKLNSFLGGYRFHGNQITADPQRYLSELPPNPGMPAGWCRLYKVLGHLPSTRGLVFNASRGKPLLPLLQLEWEWLSGPTISWSFASARWETTLSPIV
jgi:glycosyltransferase involved in cell wall biosynthesis